MAKPEPRAWLSFCRDADHSSGRRFKAIEIRGTYPNQFITHRRFDVDDAGVALGEALTRYLDDQGLTMIGEVEHKGAVMRVGVR